MKNKRLLSLLVAGAMTVSLAACGGQDAVTNNPTESTATETTETAAEPTSERPTEPTGQLVIGTITQVVNEFYDVSFNNSATNYMMYDLIHGCDTVTYTMEGEFAFDETVVASHEETENEDGTNEENIALAESFKQLVEVPDYNTAFLNLEAGAVDAIAMDIGVAQYQIAQRGDAFVILDGTIASETYGIGFKLGNTALRDTVQNTLNEMAADGTFTKIAEKWGLSEAVCLGK